VSQNPYWKEVYGTHCQFKASSIQMAARSSGNKVVISAVGAMVAALGIGTASPFILDRDKLRGLHEEQSPPTSAMLAQEIKKLQKEGTLKGDDKETPEKKGGLAPGSMWKRFQK
jgi:hypothetical protein